MTEHSKNTQITAASTPPSAPRVIVRQRRVPRQASARKREEGRREAGKETATGCRVFPFSRFSRPRAKGQREVARVFAIERCTRRGNVALTRRGASFGKYLRVPVAPEQRLEDTQRVSVPSGARGAPRNLLQTCLMATGEGGGYVNTPIVSTR